MTDAKAKSNFSYEVSSQETRYLDENPQQRQRERFVSGKVKLARELAGKERALTLKESLRQNYTQPPPPGDELLEINSKWLINGMQNSTIKVKVMSMLLINCGLPNSSKTTALKKLLQAASSLKEEDGIGFCHMLAARNELDNKIVFTQQQQGWGYPYAIYAGVERMARLSGKRIRVSLDDFSGFSKEDLNEHLMEVMMDLLEDDLRKQRDKFTGSEWDQSHTCGLALINVWDLGLNKIPTYILSHLAGHLYNSHVWMFLNLLRDVDHLYEVPDIPENRYNPSRNDKELIMRWRSRIRYFIRFAKLASMKGGYHKRVCDVIASYDGSTDLEEKMKKLKVAISNVSKQLQLQDLIDMENFEVFHNEEIGPLYHLLEKRIKDGLEYHAEEVPLSFMFLRSFFIRKISFTL
ncbi:PREDICTED: uncharacterized protein LOC109587685 [Amphimedon queenslandica]|uniref:Uncharacterized protein n=1 Tax=Amphimedon queenslandica TaxID=400682 RepID=A0AAN0JRJ1_AMPQE|nr:PREDICTED: uncharacterized protein LOC109587685 [Amphimedon queenslandica]XP_019859464.1 PREDICTED: uncharacterized protein LOC109587685 [Amphimedon queenslandica]|eukprot:XP_019859463.1 PREDICTED: uncharacterized protein LOC109587685 [Amphimedon queenslandica]